MKISLSFGASIETWRDLLVILALFGLITSTGFAVQLGEYLAFFIGSAILILWLSLAELGREKGILGYHKEAR